MFGVIFIVGVIIYSIITLVRNVAEDYEGRQLFKDESSNTYIGYNGMICDLDNGKPRFIYRENGDRYMEGDDIGKVNLSQIKRDKEYEILKQNHSKDVSVAFYQNAPNKLGVKRGVRYKDLETGEIYVVREDRYRHRYYVTLDNKVVRITDLERRCGPFETEKETNLIKEFQMEIDKASQDSFWEDPTIIFQKTKIESLRG